MPLADALLGALALGDIGKHFPDTDAQYANAESPTAHREAETAKAHRG